MVHLFEYLSPRWSKSIGGSMGMILNREPFGGLKISDTSLREMEVSLV